MDLDLRAAQSRGCIVQYTDTDSFLVWVKKGMDHGFKISPFYNDYKSELPPCTEVRAAYCGGPKNYTVRLVKKHLDSLGPAKFCKTCIARERDGSIYTDIMHVRGFCLKSRYTKNILNPERVGDYARSMLTGEGKCVCVAQFTLRVRRENRRMRTLYFVKRYRNNYPCKRVIIENSRFRLKQTLPFGFSQAMLDAASE